jgi:hypothetical protein
MRNQAPGRHETNAAEPPAQPIDRRAFFPAPLAFCAAGLLLHFYPTLLSGFARMQDEGVDTRFNNYVLEHGYLWLTGHAAHRDFWSPPIFYPQPNTAAYSDVLLGAAPFYWAWRGVGFAPDTSLQLWLLTVSALNFLAGFLLLRRGLGASTLAASAGAFVFAFAGSRAQQIGHQQLIPHFYSALALYALVRLFQAKGDSDHARTTLWVAAFPLLVAAQWYASWYMGAFLIGGLAIAFGWALALPSLRGDLLRVLRRHLIPFLGAVTFSARLLLPMLQHYVQASGEVPQRSFLDAYNTMPRLQTWLYTGAANWLYGWTAAAPFFQELDFNHEQQLGIGLVTTAAAVWGLYKARSIPLARLAALTSLTIIVATAILAASPYLTFWYFYNFPGAYATRVVCRVGLLLLIPAGIGVALAVDRLQSAGGRTRAARRRVLAGVIVGLCVLEQGRVLGWHDKLGERSRIAALAARVRPGTQSFFLTPEYGSTGDYNVNALGVQLRTGLPTVNGYSGNQPLKWPFLDWKIHTDADREAVAAALVEWARLHRMDESRITWIRVPRESLPRPDSFAAP